MKINNSDKFSIERELGIIVIKLGIEFDKVSVDGLIKVDFHSRLYLNGVEYNFANSFGLWI